MDPAAALLAPLEVTARSSLRARMLDGFEHRRTATPGVFFTQEDVEKRRPGYVTDLLATVPGVRLLSSGRGSRRTVVMGRAPGNPDCPAQVYVDGLLMNRDREFAIDDVVSPQAVHGIEVYRGISTVPADFLSPAATCGVVVIWTRRSD
jgi:outer membrane receptor for ferrienterochelin and colicin